MKIKNKRLITYYIINFIIYFTLLIGILAYSESFCIDVVQDMTSNQNLDFITTLQRDIKLPEKNKIDIEIKDNPIWLISNKDAILLLVFAITITLMLNYVSYPSENIPIIDLSSESDNYSDISSDIESDILNSEKMLTLAEKWDNYSILLDLAEIDSNSNKEAQQIMEELYNLE